MHFRRDIQGIRGLGIVAVLLGHLGLSLFGGAYVMVDAFYVISGFVITATLIGEHLRRTEDGLLPGFSLIGFYIRRLKRIFPMATVVIVATVWLAHQYWNPLRAEGVYRDAWWAFFSGGNINEILKSTDYFAKFAAQSPLGHYWSLAVEEQFYVVWPVIALVALKSALRAGKDWQRQLALVLGAVWVTSLVYSIWYTYTNLSAAYFSTFTRAWELASGALLAVLVQQRRFQEWIENPFWARLLWTPGVIAVIVAATTFSGSTWFPGYAALLPVLGSVAVIAAGTNPAIAHTRFFNNPVLVFCGRISFSLYLWHWPVFLFTPAIWPALSDGAGGMTAVGKIVALGLALSLAIISYALIERPIIRWQIGIPKEYRRPAQPGAFRTLLRDGSISLVTIWSVVAALLVTLPGNVQESDASTTTVHQAQIDHDKLLLYSQAQDGTETKRWGAELQVNLKQLDDTASLGQIQAIRDASFEPDVTGWLCDSDHLECIYGKDEASTRVLVIGDSHAYMWADALRAIVDANPDVAVSMSTTGQCPNMFDLSEIQDLPIVQRRIRVADCVKYHDWIRSSAPAFKPNVIIFSDASGAYLKSVVGAAYLRGYVKYVKWAKQLAQRVVVLGATPQYPKPSTCLTKQYTNVLACAANANRIAAEVRFQRQVASVTKVSYVETVNWFCVNARCPLFIGDTAVTPDGSHISQAIARKLAAVLWENVRPVQ